MPSFIRKPLSLSTCDFVYKSRVTVADIAFPWSLLTKHSKCSLLCLHVAGNHLRALQELLGVEVVGIHLPWQLGEAWRQHS